MALDCMLCGWAHQCPWLWEISHGKMAETLVLGIWEALPAILGVPSSEEVLVV